MEKEIVKRIFCSLLCVVLLGLIKVNAYALTLINDTNLKKSYQNKENKTNEYKVKPKNILFICVDDLRAELGCYGGEALTPHLDELARASILFENHYVQVPTSGASRCSMLTGRLPYKRQHISNNAIDIVVTKREDNDNPETFIHHLKSEGYTTVGIGKIGHQPDGLVRVAGERNEANRELPNSWSRLLFDYGDWHDGEASFFGYANARDRNSEKKIVPPYECTDVADDGYVDGLTAELAIEQLNELSSREQSFFLAVGFFKPHLPFNAPKRYWDLYDRDKISLPEIISPPQGAVEQGLHQSHEMNQYKQSDEFASIDKPLSMHYTQKLRHAYLSSVSYVDAQIGKVLEALQKSSQWDETMIVIWGDNGFQLGDHSMWGKHTLLEASLRSTLIIRTPNCKPKIEMQVVSAIDLYPTFVEWSGCSLPDIELDGTSILNLVDVKLSKTKYKNKVAKSYYSNGISVRDKRYRLTEYQSKKDTIIELYDYKDNRYEKINVANKQKRRVEKLLPYLKEADTGLYAN